MTSSVPRGYDFFLPVKVLGEDIQSPPEAVTIQNLVELYLGHNMEDIFSTCPSQNPMHQDDILQ